MPPLAVPDVRAGERRNVIVRATLLMAHLCSAGRAPARILRHPRRFSWLVPALLALWSGPAAAQIVEATGSRALGMGGAFVAVANDASATWWNPGALADAPLFNMSLERSVTESSDGIPARRDRVASFALGTVFGGFSYYRLRLTEIRDSASTEDGSDGREEEQGAIPVRSLSVSQYGITKMQTLVTGVHAGLTVKYLRGTPRAAAGPALGTVGEGLDRGDDLEGGDTHHAFDLDVGILGAYGAVKVGAVLRNVREPEFEDGAGVVMRLPRQVRLGVAFDGARADLLPLTASLDVDLRRYQTATGDRRVVALGVEHWFGSRLGVRLGGRFNTVGAEDRAVTGGLSVALRSALYVDGHLVRGGTAEDQGAGLAARVSF
jgi:hypothetical protein